MCTTCGCATNTKAIVQEMVAASESLSFQPVGFSIEIKREARTLKLERDILAKNNAIAEANRESFEQKGILALNLMSAPGSGKTTLLERTIRDLAKECTITVIEGDQETSCDAERIRKAGGKVVQINTGAGCHLDAQMVAKAVDRLAPDEDSVVIIENVGNLVCPALFDLGEFAKVVVLSVTEGEDKPLKYPNMFREAEVLLLNKIDLLPYLQFDIARCIHLALEINPNLKIIKVSAVLGTGMSEWYGWIKKAKIPNERRIQTEGQLKPSELFDERECCT